MPRAKGVPAYRRRVIRGRSVAVVTLSCSVTGQRRDVYLGDFGSPESHERYRRAIGEWEAAGRRLVAAAEPLRSAVGPTVAELVAAYWPTLAARVSPRHADNLRPLLRRFRVAFSARAAASVAPSELTAWRDALARDASPDLARRATAATLRMYRWAAAVEMLSASAYERLRLIEPLRAPPARRVGPAPPAAIEAVCGVVSGQVRAMIELQLATGMRPGEVVIMRPCDIDMREAVWVYRPPKHKGDRDGRDRLIYLGPRAQATIKPFLATRATTAYLFVPSEAVAEWRAARHMMRITPLSCGNRPGTRRVDRPRRCPGSRYTVTSYRQAIVRACDRVGVSRWHPHQLRHNYATMIRSRYGLEAARILLGHASAVVTEAVYADRDELAARRIALESG